METLEIIAKDKIPFVKIEGDTISFKIQNEPIKEVGVNGCQIEELGKSWLKILKHFQSQYPCRENALTITHIEEALMWQEARTKDREKRQVEGLNKK